MRVTGRLESAGLVGLVRTVRYDGQVQGSCASRALHPRALREQRRHRQAAVRVGDGIQARRAAGEGLQPARASGRRGARPRDAGRHGGPADGDVRHPARRAAGRRNATCSLTLFDGKRRSQVMLGAPAPMEGGVACPGEYRRLDGLFGR